VKGTDVIIAVIKIAYPIKQRTERRILEGKSIQWMRLGILRVSNVHTVPSIVVKRCCERDRMRKSSTIDGESVR